MDYIDKPLAFKERLKLKYRRRVKSSVGTNYWQSTEDLLVRPMYRLLYLIKDGPRKAEKVYLYALELMDLKYRNKLAFLLGQFNEVRLGLILDHSIAYFIPYMSEIHSSHAFYNINDTIFYNSGYNSIEVRLFAGSTDFSIIMKRALMYNSLNRLIATSDPTLLNLFLTII